jgi:hypothetical protein
LALVVLGSLLDFTALMFASASIVAPRQKHREGTKRRAGGEEKRSFKQAEATGSSPSVSRCSSHLMFASLLLSSFFSRLPDPCVQHHLRPLTPA